MDERFWFDTFSAVVLFLVAVLGSWAPLALRGNGEQSHVPAGTQESRRRAYHILNTMSGGVMLSAGFCHLLADSLKTIAFVGKRFPMATFLAAVGFLITLAADQVVHMVSESSSNSTDSQLTKHPPARMAGHTTLELTHASNCSSAAHTNGLHAAGDGSADEGGDLSDASEGRAPGRVGRPKRKLAAEQESLLGHNRHNHQVAIHQGITSQSVACLPVSTLGNGSSRHATAAAGVSGNPTGWSTCPTCHSQHRGGATGTLPLDDGSSSHYRRTSLNTRSGGGGVGDEEGGPSAGHLDVLLSDKARSLHFGTAVLLAAALCVHSVLEGMALGAQSSMRSTQDIMLAIAAHKGLAAYALGASVVESGACTRRFWAVTLTFSAATPLAIFVGYALSAVTSSAGGAALSALASGTFLYVAMMEVLPRELSTTCHQAGREADPQWMRPAKLAALLLGFGAMSLLAIWA